MPNLTIDNLQGIVRSGDAEGMFGATTIQPSRQQERRALEELGGQGTGAAAPDAAIGDGKSFSSILEKSFETVNEQQHQADRAVKELVSGRSKNIHETMLAVERADSSLKLAMQVRNKILEAYREIMRMQV